MASEQNGETLQGDSTQINAGAAEARLQDARAFEHERRLSALQSLVSQNRRDALAGRERVVNWWLSMTAMFLTLLSVLAVLAGYVGYRELIVHTETARESAQGAVKAAEEAQKYADDTRTTYTRLEAQALAEIDGLLKYVETRMQELDETVDSAGESELELRQSLETVRQMVRESLPLLPSMADLGKTGVKMTPELTFCRNALIGIPSGLEYKAVRRQTVRALEYCRKALNSYLDYGGRGAVACSGSRFWYRIPAHPRWTPKSGH